MNKMLRNSLWISFILFPKSPTMQEFGLFRVEIQKMFPSLYYAQFSRFYFENKLRNMENNKLKCL